MVAEEAAQVQGMLQRLAGRATPLLILACAVWVGLLALLNVRERRSEIGLLRALGKGSGAIVTLFLGKAVLVGLIGGALGGALGVWLASSAGAAVAGMGPEAVSAASAGFRPSGTVLAATLLAEGEETAADVFFAQDPASLGAVTDLMAELPQATLDLVGAKYRDDGGRWVGTSGRVRVVVHNIESGVALPQTIDDVTGPDWAGQLGVAPTNGSFLAFVSAAAEALAMLAVDLRSVEDMRAA